jgi:hypothetical protein
VAIALLPSPRRKSASEPAATLALSFARCPGAPYCMPLNKQPKEASNEQ